MKRREFITLLAGGSAALPLAARAQPRSVRRVGVISTISENDPEAKKRLTAFQQGLEQLGWNAGRNIGLDLRWTNRADVPLAQMVSISREMVALGPEVILVQSNPGVAALRQVTSTIPIVFVSVADPVESGFVEA
jgi:putative ABC transport system substrate-binding protein